METLISGNAKSAKSQNFFQDTLSFLCNNLGLNNLSASGTQEHDDKKQDANKNNRFEKSHLQEDERKIVLLIRDKLCSSLKLIDRSQADKNYSILLNIATSSISLSSSNEKNSNEDDIPKSIEKQKRKASFMSQVQEIEANILPSKFGLTLLKIFLISLSQNTYENMKSKVLGRSDSEVELVEIMFAGEDLLNQDLNSSSTTSGNLFLNFISLCLGKTNDKYSILRVLFALATDNIESLGVCDDQNNERVLREFFHRKWEDIDVENKNSYDDYNENERQIERTLLFADADCLVDISYRLALAVKILDDTVDSSESCSYHLQQLAYKSLQDCSLATSLFESCDSSSMRTEHDEKNVEGRSTKKRYVSFNTFVNWHNSKFPFFSSTFPALMRRLIFPRIVAKIDYESFQFFPVLTEASNLSESTYLNFNSSDTQNMFSFGCLSENFQGKVRLPIFVK